MAEAERQSMSDDNTHTDLPARTEAAIAAEPEARRYGWSPIERWRGDPNEWVDADEFLRRGKDYIPILRSNNEKLQGELSGRDAKIADLEAKIAQQGKDLEAIQETNEEAAAAARVALRETLINELAAAQETNDANKVARATANLSAHDAESAAPKAAPTKAASAAETRQAGPDPSAVRAYTEAVAADFEWFSSTSQDPLAVGKRATLGQVIRQMQSDGRIAQGMNQVDATKLAATEVDKMYGMPVRTTKVSGSRPSGGGGSSKSYADLPADAKSACDRMVKRFQSSGSIGEGKQWKTPEDYRKHYVSQFTAQGGFD